MSIRCCFFLKEREKQKGKEEHTILVSVNHAVSAQNTHSFGVYSC